MNNINKIKRKVNIMNYNQRELQNRISDIQVQEAKIDEMEKTLQNAKNIYSENIKNEKKESSNIKVKIKQLAKKEDELNLELKKSLYLLNNLLYSCYNHYLILHIHLFLLIKCLLVSDMTLFYLLLNYI